MASNCLDQPTTQDLVQDIIKVHVENVHCTAPINILSYYFKKCNQMSEPGFPMRKAMLTTPDESLPSQVRINLVS